MTVRQPDAPDPKKPPGLRERKKVDTRRRIFRAAVELFTAKGFEATTVEEIAERADVGKGTVFNYFPRKTAFLVASYQEWAVRIREDLGPEESWTDPVRMQLEKMFGYLTDLADRHRELARQVIFENMRQAHLRFTRGQRKGAKAQPEPTTNPSGSDRNPEAVRLLEDLTLEVIQRGADRGEVRQGVDPRHAASVIAAAVFQSLIRGLIHGDSSVEIEAGIGARLDLIFSGLAPEAKEQP